MFNIKEFLARVQTSSISRRMGNGLMWSFSGTAIAKLLTLSLVLYVHIFFRKRLMESSPWCVLLLICL